MSSEDADKTKPNEPARNTALVQRAQVEPWQDPQWQQLWLSIESRPWRSLALVPAGQGGPVDLTVGLAVTLSRTGMVHIGTAIQVADATRVPLNQLSAFLEEVRRCTSTGARLLVALPPAHAGPIMASIAQALDAAILCVLLEEMASADARRTLKLVGASRFLGSVMIHPHQLEQAR